MKERKQRKCSKKFNKMLGVLIFRRNFYSKSNSPGDTAVLLRQSLYSNTYTVTLLEITGTFKRVRIACYMYNNTTLEDNGVSKLYGISLIYAWDLKCATEDKERNLLFQPHLFKLCVDTLQRSLFTWSNSIFFTSYGLLAKYFKMIQHVLETRNVWLNVMHLLWQKPSE